MSKSDKAHKTWETLKKIGFAVLTSGMLYLMYTLLFCIESSRFDLIQETRGSKLVESSNFWLGVCFAIPQVMLTAACVVKLIRMILNTNETKPLFPQKIRKTLFIIALCVLFILPVFCFRYGIIYHASYDAGNEQTVNDANRYYPYVNGVEFLIGFIIWLIIDWRREVKLQKEKSISQ